MYKRKTEREHMRGYIDKRRDDIMASIDELGEKEKQDWYDAAQRLIDKEKVRRRDGKIYPMSLMAALEILVTVYATDAWMECRDLAP
jgi:hypothetical protein